VDVTAWSQGRRRVVAVLLLSSAFLAPSAAHAAPAPPSMPDVIAERGLGDSQNSYAWSMAWFKGKLYVGTGRSVMCVETAVTQYYFRSENFYTTQPALNVRCPANRYDLDLRAEIWQYTPQTGRWRMVYRSPADIRNPRSRGKFLARDIAFRGMKVVRDHRGREALFIAGVTANEYVPENARRHPPRLLRTYDGKRFHNISVPLIVRRAGQFIDRRPVGYRGLEVIGNRLYVVASTALTGDGAIFEVRNAFGRKGRFTQVTPRNMHVFEMQRFDGQLYLGTGSYETGFGVYKMRRTRRTPYRFQAVVTNGAGVGRRMVSVVSMYPFRGHLYVGVVSWYNADELPASELIRVGHRGQWEVVTGDPRPGPDGQMRNPISGLPAGFGNIFNSHLWRMVQKDGTLYVGTLDWSWLLQDSESWAEEWAPVVDAVLTPEYGFDLWASCDGVDWFPVTRNAFNGDPFDFGIRTLAAGRRGFFIGSANHAFGTRIWHYRQPDCGSSTGAHSARAAQEPRLHAAEAPRHVLTDVQRDGTVVSWEPSDGAVRYRVERAEYLEAPLSVSRPPATPGGLVGESAVPQPTPPGAPGTMEVRVPVKKPPTVLGTTTRPYFVDRTRRLGTQYEYQVFAENTSPGAGVPSNVQIVPDPRPPATFDQLEAALSRADAAAAAARMHRLLRGRSVERLLRLARTTADNSVRQLAYRLGRRLEYQLLAGGPARGG
jgi:hypothetical protein